MLISVQPGLSLYQNAIILKDDGSGGDNWSCKTCKNCKALVKLSPPTYQQPTFYKSDALPVAQPSVRALKGESDVY